MSGKGDVARMKVGMSSLSDSVAAVAVGSEWNCSRKGYEVARMDLVAPERYENPVQMVACGNPKAMRLRERVHSAETPVPAQRMGVGQVQRRAATVRLPRPQILMAATVVPPACRYPYHLQMSGEIPGATADQQASQELHWQATIGGCHINATALGEGATD